MLVIWIWWAPVVFCKYEHSRLHSVSPGCWSSLCIPWLLLNRRGINGLFGYGSQAKIWPWVHGHGQI